MTDDDGREITFTHKSHIHPKTIQVNVTVPGQKNPSPSTRSRWLIIPKKNAKKQKRNRDIMVTRAKGLITYPKKYGKVTAAGSGAYVRNLAFDKSTGEIVDVRELVLDEAKFTVKAGE